jgi:Uma2 family endonuclease
MPSHTPTAEPRLRLGPADDGRVLSADEFADAEYEEPWQYERVEGRLVVTPPDGMGHQRSASPWRKRLDAYQLQRPDVVSDVFPNPWIRDRVATDRIGDLGVYLTRPDGGCDYPDQPPDIMFEIVSPTAQDRRRDYEEKRADYLRMGVREYVIIDRFRSQVTVLTRVADAFQERVLGLQGVYTTPLLPGFAVRISEAMPA